MLRPGVLDVDLVYASALTQLLVVVTLELVFHLLSCSLVPGVEECCRYGTGERPKDIDPADGHIGVRLRVTDLVGVADVSVDRLAEAEGWVQAGAGPKAELEAEGLHVAEDESFD